MCEIGMGLCVSTTTPALCKQYDSACMYINFVCNRLATKVFIGKLGYWMSVGDHR